MPFKDKQKARTYRRKHHGQLGIKIAGIIAEFRKNGCKKCNEKDKDCLCAHHRNPKKKMFGIGSVASIRPSLERLKEELKKCTCLCLNCHAKLHARKRRREKRNA
jgi:hypothetical protein